MGDAVIVANKNYRFLIFNPAAERMFGTGAIETKAEGGPAPMDSICPTWRLRFQQMNCPSRAAYVVPFSRLHGGPAKRPGMLTGNRRGS